MKGYVYRMFDEGGVVYVGHTKDMKLRMSYHFSRRTRDHDKQIPTEELRCIRHIDYVELNSLADMRVLEAYLIALYQPKYNKDFVEGDELTFRLDYGDLEWREWKQDNPEHHIFIWKDGELLYEIPREQYDALRKELGITQNRFGYGEAVYENGYKLMRLSGRKRSRTKKAKYSYAGYPEKWE